MSSCDYDGNLQKRGCAIPFLLCRHEWHDAAPPPAPRDEAPGDVGGDRDALGRRVREVWVAWAKRQPAPKSSWLVPYDELSEADKEADRCIGAALWGDGFRCGLDAAQSLSSIAVPAAVRERERAVIEAAVAYCAVGAETAELWNARWREAKAGLLDAVHHYNAALRGGEG